MKIGYSTYLEKKFYCIKAGKYDFHNVNDGNRLVSLSNLLLCVRRLVNVNVRFNCDWEYVNKNYKINDSMKPGLRCNPVK